MGCENGTISYRMLLAASLLCAVCEQIPPATVCDREWFWKTSSSCPFLSVSLEQGWFNRLQALPDLEGTWVEIQRSYGNKQVRGGCFSSCRMSRFKAP
ncbi:hypothetical protein Tco_0783097 [Tanacetum coccineum]